jgi:multidrug resistance efflux pump
MFVFLVATKSNLSAQTPPRESSPPVTNASTQETERQLRKAREVASDLKDTALTYRRLSKSGSISKQESRAATVEYKLAELDVLAIEFPEKRELIDLTRAKIEYEFKANEFAILDRLHRNGSVSQLEHERARSERDIAKLKYESAENKRKSKLHNIKIAQRKLALAEDEFDKAKRLLQSRSISESTYEKVLKNLHIAKQGVAIAKKSVGVNVTVIRQD